jgi:hypothetical protein
MQFCDGTMRSARGMRAQIYRFPRVKTVVAKYRSLAVFAGAFREGFPLMRLEQRADGSVSDSEICGNLLKALTLLPQLQNLGASYQSLRTA